jgi:hypothetical protein
VRGRGETTRRARTDRQGSRDLQEPSRSVNEIDAVQD